MHALYLSKLYNHSSILVLITLKEWIKISSGRPVVQSFTAAYHAGTKFVLAPVGSVYISFNIKHFRVGGTMVEWDVTTSNFTPGCQVHTFRVKHICYNIVGQV